MDPVAETLKLELKINGKLQTYMELLPHCEKELLSDTKGELQAVPSNKPYICINNIVDAFHIAMHRVSLVSLCFYARDTG